MGKADLGRSFRQGHGPAVYPLHINRKLKIKVLAGGARLEDYASPLFIAWQLTNVCDCRCLHCLEESGPKAAFPGELNRREIFKILKEIAMARVPYVAFGGGEPLSHPLFFDICEYLSGCGINLKIETNGHCLSAAAARRLAKLSVKAVQVSLDGPCPATHQALRPGADFNKALSAFDHLARYGVRSEAVFVPTRLNIDEIKGAIELAARHKAAAFITGPMMRLGRAACAWNELAPTKKQLAVFKKTIAEQKALYEGGMEIIDYPWNIIQELKFRFRHPQALLLIVPNGLAKLINAMPFACGDLRQDSLISVWEKAKTAWKHPQVARFVKRAVTDHALLAAVNKPVLLHTAVQTVGRLPLPPDPGTSPGAGFYRQFLFRPARQ
ncbi:MAG: radical SAM protein [Elusimicrobia bacterium]|nr:radical SAM protein [Elusimicrobiota bacterium]